MKREEGKGKRGEGRGKREESREGESYMNTGAHLLKVSYMNTGCGRRLLGNYVHSGRRAWNSNLKVSYLNTGCGRRLEARRI